MTTYALRLENGTDTAARVRMADMLALPAGAAPLTSRSALRADGGGAVTVLSGTMNVRVAPFLAWVQGGVSVAQAGYPFVHDAQVDLAIAAGHASLARIDVIAGVVRDNSFDSSGQVSASVQVIQGTPGAGAPALPANSVALRNINVPAGASAGSGGLTGSSLGTDRRVYLTVPPPITHQAAGNLLDATTTAAPSNPSGLKIVTGRVEATLSGGQTTIVFPTDAFPGGLLSFHCMTISGSSVAPVVNGGAISKTQTTVILPGAGTAAVVLSYTAIGY